MDKREVGIVIPYYHSNLTELEQVSLSQCIKILGKYPIILLMPDTMQERLSGTKGLLVERVPAEWLQSVESYNLMMLSTAFYERFVRYNYILIYQLDAFVFCDRLQEMCEYGYDYIGAPWLYGYFYYVNAQKCIWHVGNGGFSLRKVDSFIRLLEKKQDMRTGMHEDFYYAVSDCEEFKTAPLNIALQFAFESDIERCFCMNHNQLPFGCHAWEKYNFDFWRPYIKQNGYEVGQLEKYTKKKDEVLEALYCKNREKSYFWENIFSIEFFKNKLKKAFGGFRDAYIIWGAGYWGKLLCKILKEADLTVKYVIDSNISLTGQYVEGYEIKSTLDEKEKGCFGVIIAIKQYGWEVAERLKGENCRYQEDFILLEDILNELQDS